MAYANRRFLKMVHETGKLGRVAFKPTQAMEDGINAGLLSWLLQGTKFEVGRKYAVDGYVEHPRSVDRIIALLPKDFKAGMENWGGRIEQHISDTNFGLLHLGPDREAGLHRAGDRSRRRPPDRSARRRLRSAARVRPDRARSRRRQGDMNQLWTEMGYTTGNGRDMTSVMYRMSGPPIHEQTLGSADAMLLRLLDGDESMGGTKQPYDPRIHFVLIRDAYLDANPGNDKLRAWLDDALAKFDAIYSDKRPGFLEGYKALKEAIKPWGQ